jgi:hypothetical protein
MKQQSCFLILAIIICTSALSQDYKQSIGVSVGYGIPFENSIYINFDDPDFEIWSTPSLNITGAIIYDYTLNDVLKIGARFEYEKINFESFYTDKTYANRFSVGVEFLCTYPKTALHAEMGGYFQVGRVNSEDFDNPVTGFDNGLLIGPGFRIENINIALLFQPSFGYYFISNGSAPQDGLVMYPKSTLKVSYSF